MSMFLLISQAVSNKLLVRFYTPVYVQKQISAIKCLGRLPIQTPCDSSDAFKWRVPRLRRFLNGPIAERLVPPSALLIGWDCKYIFIGCVPAIWNTAACCWRLSFNIFSQSLVKAHNPTSVTKNTFVNQFRLGPS